MMVFKHLFTKRSVLIILLGISSYAFALSPMDSIGVANINGKLHIKYLVSPGETIYGISSKHGIPISDLMEINPELENGLKVGQVINIPYNNTKAPKEGQIHLTNSRDSELNSKSQSSPALRSAGNSKKVIHKVQAGETLYSLSRKYNVSVNDLMKWNNLELKIGQEVIVTPGEDLPDEKIPTGGTVVVAKPVENPDPDSKNKNEFGAVYRRYEIDSSRQQILIIPFDPYLYFSDADDEIAARSNIHRTKVRQVFRRRMNALLDHPAYENIHLLGGQAKDSLTDLNKIYTSVTYNYHDILENPDAASKQTKENKAQENLKSKQNKATTKSWLEKQKDKITPQEASGKAVTAKDNGKYFGVLVKNPDLYRYFNEKYDIDYYIFVNQFEVKTNYENCLDRAALNYERTFTTHYSIFDNTGKQISGNRFNTHYNSNSNNIEQILADNMQKIADKILSELPLPKVKNHSAKKEN